MYNANLKLVIVGHVDHGKSTLIGRLLFDTDSLPEGQMDEIRSVCKALGREVEFGFVMDHLEEERDQGVTIDTAQTFFHTTKRDYVIIDAPGHVEFVKNMITGASQAEAAVLIVDADEGVMEQTRRHAYILGMLGLRQIIVVVNKMDLVGFKREAFDVILDDLTPFLASIDITPNHIIPVSAKEGDNIARSSSRMSWFTGPTVLAALDGFKPLGAPTDKPLRFSVQDVYKFDKRIVVGRVESGILRAGDIVLVLPSNERSRIESIEEFLKDDVKEAGPGMAVGIVLSDKLFVERGNIVCSCRGPPTVTETVRAHLFWMDKVPFTKGERLKLKLTTQEAMCEVTDIERVIDSSTLEVVGCDVDQVWNRQVADIVLRMSAPIMLDDFNSIPAMGRFVLERRNTVAGGIITGDR